MTNRNVAAWFRREDYARIKSIMDDGHRLPPTFDEWEGNAKAQQASAAKAGITIEPVILDPDEFLAYCKANKLSNRGSRERSMFAIARGSARKLQ